MKKQTNILIGVALLVGLFFLWKSGMFSKLTAPRIKNKHANLPDNNITLVIPESKLFDDRVIARSFPTPPFITNPGIIGLNTKPFIAAANYNSDRLNHIFKA